MPPDDRRAHFAPPSPLAPPAPVAGPLRTASGPGSAPPNPFPDPPPTSEDDTPDHAARPGCRPRGLGPRAQRAARPARPGRLPELDRPPGLRRLPTTASCTSTAPTSFIGTWVSRNYGDTIRHLLCKNGVAVSRLEFGVAPAARRRRAAAGAARGASPPTPRPAAVPDVDLPASPLDGRCTFDNFVVGKPNELAHAARAWRGVAEGGPVNFNPLFLYGGVGLGKTHLDARHRLGGAADEPRGARPLPLRRAVHVPLRLGAALQGHARLQGDVPLGRHADGRRRAVHLRQGLDARRSSSTPSTR